MSETRPEAAAAGGRAARQAARLTPPSTTFRS